MKDYARSFYKGKAWRNTQAAYMGSQHYICERCGDMAKIVHHKTYITPENINDPNITLSWSNLEALCQDCHTRQHLAGEICAEGLSFNSKGELIYTPRQNKKD
jgi:5-methylcytosine-specific restriction endonuclease McrA